MKISCQSCAAKYTIADEKVVGKVIKIKCKKCGATIVVNGNDPAALAQQLQAEAASFDDNAATQLFAQADANGPQNPDEWTVSVTDEDQRTMTTAQVVQAYGDGTIASDTFIWKDGMADWLPLAEVAELAPLLSGANGKNGGAPYAPPPAGSGSFGPGGGAAYETTASVASPVMPAAAAAMAMPAPMAAPMPAARRAGGRGNVDLFGSRDAGGAAQTAANSAAQNIGERNESSVLFSLSALTAAEEQAKKPEPVRSSFQMSNDRVDDILSLGGGIGTAPMLAPPPMNAPIIEAPPPPPMSVAPPSYGPPGMGMASAMPYGMQQQEQKKASPVGFIVGGVGLLAAVGVLVFFLTRGSGGEQAKTDSTSKTDASKDDDKKPAETAKPVESVAMADTSKPADTAKPADTTTADTGKPADTGAVPSTDPKDAKAFQAAIDAKKNDPKKTPDPKTPDPKTVKTADPKTPDPKTPDPTPPAGGGGEFDRGAASAQLSAKAGGASGCKKPDGPTGSAKVQVTFAPSGKATQATVGAPFAGTPVGSCIASLFKGASVPPFSGAAMTVSKTVSIK